MTTHRIHLVISGVVQGVFFRASTRSQALALGLCGRVSNLPNGSVDIHAEGPKETLEKLIKWCHSGPPAARVDRVEINWETATGEFETFIIQP